MYDFIITVSLWGTYLNSSGDLCDIERLHVRNEYVFSSSDYCFYEGELYGPNIEILARTYNKIVTIYAQNKWLCEDKRYYERLVRLNNGDVDKLVSLSEISLLSFTKDH